MIFPEEESIGGRSEATVDAAFEKSELKLLEDSLKRSYKERFLFATRLYKIGQTLARATITHQPDVSPKRSVDGPI